MIVENFFSFFKLYVKPTAAMSALIDGRSWLFAALLAVAVSVALHFTLTSRIYEAYEAVETKYAVEHDTVWGGSDEDDAPPETVYVRKPLPVVGTFGWRFVSFSATENYTTTLRLTLLYVPVTILALTFFAPIGSFGVALQRDYGPLLMCACASWAAAYLPGVALGAWFSAIGWGGGQAALAVWTLCTTYFAILMVLAIRTVFGVNFAAAAGVVAVSWAPILLWGFVFALLRPFLLFWILPVALAAFAALRSAHRTQQGFRRNLEAATLNARDAEARVQLGLMYQRRRQYGTAAVYFQKALEIDPKEPDANFQLGRIVRERGRLQEALGYFEVVVVQDDKFSLSEIWREIGVTYLTANMLEDAQAALERYVERRPYDPEGLYQFGEALRRRGDASKAKEIFQQCVEAVQTLPYYRRGAMKRWSKLAGERLRGGFAERDGS